MATTSIRRLKERGGSGAKITAPMPTKSLTPLSLDTAKKSATKDNPNPRSRVSGLAQKPAIRPVPRLSSLPSGDSETRPKSRPRGRSPSPSDFNRILSDMRKIRVSDGSRVLEKKGEKGVNGFRVSSVGKENAALGGKISDSSGNNSKRSSGIYRKETNLAVSSVRSSVDEVKDRNFSGVDGIGNENGVLELSSKGSSVCKGKGGNEEGGNGRVGNKQTSKLHEKLAYLEGKVKRIASDIKKTKEMLDSNNTDASKMILSDIQEKISGIEKAMGNVIVDSKINVSVDSFSDSKRGDSFSDSGDAKSVGIDAKGNKRVEAANMLVKGLSGEELEARLFPHHKLLRSRTSSKVSASGSQGYDSNVLELNCGSNTENSTNPVDVDAIALEFLDSLNKMQPELSATNNGTLESADEVRETGDTETSSARQSSSIFAGKHSIEVDLQADERLDEFDDQENKPAMIVGEEMEDIPLPQLIEIGRKTSTGGWFVSEGESVLLAHDDGSCSFYDIVNHEEKAEYRPPAGISQNIWRDCWIIRAPGADGCSGKYVVAASAGNTMDSGFCSWDFYSKEVHAFHTEDYKTAPRVALGPLPDNVMYRRTALGGIMSSENQQWWYRPCGPLIVCTASCQRAVKVFDIRDGEEIMKWDVQKPVLAMDYSSPLQWRNRGKVVVAETEAISLWDVSSMNPQALSSVSTSGRRISALHVNNTDAELGGGVRQRVSSSEAEGNDGVFCTADSMNILDFRQPSGIGLKIPKIGVSFECVSSRGDSVFLGCSTVTSTAKKQVSSQVLQFSLRKQRIVNTYVLPESDAHSHHRALTQVWGNSNHVMAVSGLGLFVFDTLRDDVLPSYAIDYSSPQKVREVIGPDDLYSPSFDYISSQVLLISRDRPAMWRHLS